MSRIGGIKKVEVFSVRLPRDIAKQVSQHARLDGETASAMLRTLIKEALASPERSGRLLRGLTDDERKALPQLGAALLQALRSRGNSDKDLEAKLERLSRG